MANNKRTEKKEAVVIPMCDACGAPESGHKYVGRTPVPLLGPVQSESIPGAQILYIGGALGEKVCPPQGWVYNNGRLIVAGSLSPRGRRR